MSALKVVTSSHYYIRAPSFQPPPMLSRSIARTAARHVTSTPLPPPPQPPCTLCTCICGTLFLPHQQQRRPASSGRKAPSTYAKARREEARVLTPGAARERKKLIDFKANAITSILSKASGAFQVMNPASAAAFMQDFEKLVEQHKGRNVDKSKFEALVKESGLPGIDLYYLTLILLKLRDHKYLGKKLLFALSFTGSEEATIAICSHALLGSKITPNLLRSAEIVYARGHLKELARGGKSYRAMVLEGKIMRVLGDENEALDMWEKGMDAAVKEGQRVLDMKKRGIMSELDAEQILQRRDMVELSSPWIELTLLRYDRYTRFYERNDITQALAEYDKAKAAAEIGCRMDDPTSHYHTAEFFKGVNPDGTTIHTSSWLYHMTKAATTGHAIACHKLGVFYAESGWKYIEDEPPDHVKPTPFDSFPPDSGDDSTSILSTVKRMFTFTSPSTTDLDQEKKESDDLFHTAIFPSTPQHRWLLATHWLRLGMKHMYAPSYLYSAQMLLQERLWAQAQAPKAAIEMSERRYEFATKADWENGVRIPKPDAERIGEVEDPVLEHTEKDLALAKKYLTSVLQAHKAHTLYTAALTHQQKISSRGPRLRGSQDPNVVLDESALDGRRFNFGDEISEEVREWFSFPDVREMWAPQAERLAEEARGILDERGWDAVEGEGKGGLVYKAKTTGRAGEGG